MARDATPNYDSEELSGEESASEDGEIQQPVKVEADEQALASAPEGGKIQQPVKETLASTCEASDAQAGMADVVKQIFNQQISGCKARHAKNKFEKLDGVKGGPSGSWGAYLIVMGCSLKPSADGQKKNKMVSMLSLGKELSAGYATANYTIGSKGPKIPDSELYKVYPGMGLQIARSYRKSAKGRGPPEPEFGPLAAGEVVKACLWGDQEGGVIEQLRAEGFDSLNVGDIVLANFSVTHRDSASAGRNGLLSCKAIKVQTQVSPWYSDSFSNLPNPTDDASAEAVRIELAGGDYLKKAPFDRLPCKINPKIGSGDKSTTTVYMVLRPDEKAGQVVTEGGKMFFRFFEDDYAGIGCRKLTLRMNKDDFNLVSEDEQKTLAYDDWVENLFSILLIAGCVNIFVAYDKYNGPPTTDSIVHGYISADDGKFLNKCRGMTLVPKEHAAYAAASAKLGADRMAHCAVGELSEDLCICVDTRVVTKDRAPLPDPSVPLCSLLHPDNLDRGHDAFLLVKDDDTGEFSLALKIALPGNAPAASRACGPGSKRKFAEVDVD